MRIGIFTDTYEPEINGVVTSILQLKGELEKNGHQVFIITTSEKNTTSIDNKILKIPGIKLKKLYGYRITSLYPVYGVSYIKKMNLDIIHVHTEGGLGVFSRIVSKQLKLPLVYTYHTMYEDYTHYISKGYFDEGFKKLARKISQLFGDSCTELIVPSTKVEVALRRYGVDKNFNVIPTGISLDKFSPHLFSMKELEDLKKSLNLSPKKFTILFVGRLAKEKSIDDIFRALKIMKEKTKNVQLLIVGDGPERENLEQLAKELKIDDSVIFSGRVPLDQVPKFYQIANVFVSTSQTETQGLTFIEAMASHLPVVCKFDTQLEDLIENGKNGFFINDEKDLAAKLLNFKYMPIEEYSLYQRNALKTSQNYSSSVFYEKIMNVYNMAIIAKRNEIFYGYKDK